TRLALEAAHRHVVVREALGQNLDRHRAPQHQILSAPHRRHASGGEAPADPVAIRKAQVSGLCPGLPSRTHWGRLVPGWLVSNPRSDTDGTGLEVPRARLLYSARCPKSVTCAPRVRPLVITAATRWSRPGAASIRTSSGSASTTAGHHVACTSARAASRPARSPKHAENRRARRRQHERRSALTVAVRGRATDQTGISDPSIVRFRALVEAGLAALEARREEVNDLNVFPVADGDTGDNMVLTLRAVLNELDRLADVSEGRTIDEIGRDEIVASVARAALLGARGNSGVILSQLIRGAAEEPASRPGGLVDPVMIGAALARAAEQAYGSVRDPAEGNILTVVRQMSHLVATEIAHIPDARLRADASTVEQDIAIASVIESALEAGQESVK